MAFLDRARGRRFRFGCSCGLAVTVCALNLAACSTTAAAPPAARSSQESPAASTASQVTSPRAASPPTGAALTAQLEPLVRTMGGTMNDFSGAVLITRGNQVLLARAYGVADEKHRTPVTLSTRFDIASITKQFTAMAILILEHRGRLHLSDSICRYVADCPPTWPSITLAELLTHSSGVPSPNVPTPATYLEHDLALFRNLPLSFTPGTAYEYSNAGYILLGVVVEKVSGMSYEAFLAENIFGPLRMRNSGYDHGHQGVAVGYASTGKLGDPIDMRVPFSAGGLYSTVEDLHNWQRALSSGTLVPKPVVAEMDQPRVKVGNAATNQYGYGVFVDESGDPNHPTVEVMHPGQLPGFTDLLARYPESGLDIVILSNHGDTNLNGIDDKVRQLVLGY